jgi:complex iron-sulfur molybdoenzyme family reductase subunit gamma
VISRRRIRWLVPLVALAVLIGALLIVRGFWSDREHPADGTIDTGFIAAHRIAAEPPLDPLDAAWAKLAPSPVALYPQVSVAPATQPSGALTVSVRAFYSRKALALHLEWPDPRPAQGRGVGKFADGAAVQWPVHYGSGKALPYVGMGHAGVPVALWFWRADGSVETLAAEGFGTLTAQPTDGVEAKGIWKDGIWRVVFTRPLRAVAADHRLVLEPAAQGLVPVAFAIWNGEAQERDGLKRLSAWQALRFEQAKVDEAYAKQLAEVAIAGDIESGKRLMADKGCAGCHAFPGNPGRPSVGPDLTYTGGIHSAQYLRESLSEPSRVVVPGKRYASVQDGKPLASLMPPFVGTEQELQDIVAYLKTLH